MLLHAREGHVKFLGKVRDRSVCTPKLLQHAASGGIRERGERSIEAGLGILNHLVQYITHGLTACKGRQSARCLAGRLHSEIELISMQIRSTRRSPGPKRPYSSVLLSRMTHVTTSPPCASAPSRSCATSASARHFANSASIAEALVAQLRKEAEAHGGDVVTWVMRDKS